MMMAPDSTPDEPELSQATIDALQAALQKYLVDTDQVTALQPALRRIASEAREKKMRAVMLLILLKDVWFALPQIRRMPEGEGQNRLLQRVVTLCIREYYST
jgi:hypothetical protein